ncbi:uncharacterized protein LOC121595435 isoform X2 [Anopheles merus]|uniref:uncharacterized protein LOC121595435 isoform X2 n=1 Tax=Anopheles merus TaxID=30066 RepID=UPI001BE409C8|nr:uncharacterized protein LOC121595435 isoform X2 [Anopheles merus]
MKTRAPVRVEAAAEAKRKLFDVIGYNQMGGSTSANAQPAMISRRTAEAVPLGGTAMQSRQANPSACVSTEKKVLIRLVSGHPMLWKSTDKFYNNRSQTARAWGEIARHLGTTVARCQKVWHQLRYKYREIRIRELEAVNKTGYPPTPPTWHCYRAMSFLRECVDESLRVNGLIERPEAHEMGSPIASSTRWSAAE